MHGLAKTAAEPGAIELIEHDRPTIGSDEALVEVAYAGLCGSDIGVYNYEGAYEFMSFPRILGHEYAGTVVEVGDDVTDVAVGDRVVEAPNHGCGECYQCRSARPNLCREFTITGLHHHGAFTEYVATPTEYLYHVPDNLPLRTAAATEPTAVAARAVVANSRTTAGDRVLVEGPGPIGLLTAQIARRQGGDVVVSGVGQDEAVRLPAAATLGFETANVATVAAESLREEYTDGRGFDVVFDATGHESGLQTAADVVRKGGQVVLIGQSGHVALDYTPFIRGEVDIQCSYAAAWPDFDRALRLLSSGAVQADPLFDDRFDIADEEAVFEAAMHGEAVKPLFELAGE
jgi:L-iditol 2-dehydrogenase